MKTFKYLKREFAEVTPPGGERIKVSALGRSNSSESDAAADARSRLRKVEAKLSGAEVPGKADYSADILEEVVAEVERGSVVTRNRYGALVLNTETTVIIDIDHHQRGFLELLGLKKREKKAAIAEDLEKVAARPEYADLGFRLYETANGMRVIVTGVYCEPGGRGGRLMGHCNADPLFAFLCERQNCYRARLTPKPYRVKQRHIRYRWPLEGRELEEARRWITEYEEKCRGKAVCRYIKTLGRQDMPGRVVNFHDKETGASSGLPLA